MQGSSVMSEDIKYKIRESEYDALIQELETLRAENEAKDAQIRVLVEALRKAYELNEPYCNSEDTWEETDNIEGKIQAILKQALVTIPAETLERAKLEREVVEAGEDVVTTYRRHCELTNEPYKIQAGFDRPHARLVDAHKALEAHKEKVACS
jgi:hypothetical protein